MVKLTIFQVLGLYESIRGSSNGRTLVSGTNYRSSNLCPRANTKIQKQKFKIKYNYVVEVFKTLFFCSSVDTLEMVMAGMVSFK
jgi:hypothetical protein